MHCPIAFVYHYYKSNKVISIRARTHEHIRPVTLNSHAVEVTRTSFSARGISSHSLGYKAFAS